MNRTFLDSGIIQFGWFDDGLEASFVRFKLELIAAYPNLLDIIAEKIVHEIDVSSFERIVTMPDATPVGAVVSVKTGIPLVYSKGRGEIPVHDLIGAYDVGHPTCLITLSHAETTQSFVKGCRRVGLEVEKTIEVMRIYPKPEDESSSNRASIYMFEELLIEAVNGGYLTREHAQRIQEQIKTMPSSKR